MKSALKKNGDLLYLMKENGEDKEEAREERRTRMLLDRNLEVESPTKVTKAGIFGVS